MSDNMHFVVEDITNGDSTSVGVTWWVGRDSPHNLWHLPRRVEWSGS